jgi:hypothetical protein
MKDYREWRFLRENVQQEEPMYMGHTLEPWQKQWIIDRVEKLVSQHGFDYVAGLLIHSDPHMQQPAVREPREPFEPVPYHERPQSNSF